MVCFGVDMSVRYEMQIRTKSDPKQKWHSFDNKKTIKELDCYNSYEKHSLYDARIIKITTTKETIIRSDL